MLIVGLTGGIGSGKSTVSRMFSALGVPVLDADGIGHELVAPGSPCLTAITKTFGNDLLTDQGELNRDELRKRILADRQARQTLESIMHPAILAEMQHRIATLNAPYCVLAIPLLFEANQAGTVQRILVIDAPEALQRQRVKERNGWPDEQITAVLNTQISRAQRNDRADDVIVNDGGIDELKHQVEMFHLRYLELAKRYR